MQLCVPDLLTTLEGSPKKLEKPPIGVIHPESGEFYVPEVQSPQSMLVSTVAASSPTVGSSTKNTRSSALKPPQKHSDPPLAVAAAQAKAVSIGPPPMRPFSAAGVTTSVSPAGLSSPTTSSRCYFVAISCAILFVLFRLNTIYAWFCCVETKLTHVISLLLHYATFLTRAKGDIEAAGVVYAKAMEIDPNNVQLLVQFGHFLAEEENKGKKAIAYRLRERDAKRQWLEDNSEDEDSDEEMAPLQDPMCHRNTNLGLHITRGWTVDQLYGMALKLDPTNAVATLGYAKYLRKCHKMAQAEVMYSAAYKLSASSVTTTSSDSLSKAKNHKFAPMAMCNYATFLYQHHGKVKRNLTASGMRDGESTAEQDKQISEADNGIRMAKILFEGGICK